MSGQLSTLVVRVHEIAASWEQSPSAEHRCAAPLLRAAADLLAHAQRLIRRKG